MSEPFRGVGDLDIRDSTPDWLPSCRPVAPPGMPNIDRIADAGLRCTQWHTTALRSPTRSCLLTDRNHTTNGMACRTETATGFPNGNGHVPAGYATLPEALVERGISTAMVGEWHLCTQVDTDRPEVHGLPAREPVRLAEPIGLCSYEAGADHAFPLDDRSALEIVLTPRPPLVPVGMLARG